MGYLASIKTALRRQKLSTEAAATATPWPQKTGGKRLPTTYQAVFRTRKDIKSWNIALDMWNAMESRTYPYQLLLDEIMLDAHITSQIQNRKQQLFLSDFVLKNSAGDIDEEQTKKLKKSGVYRALTDAVLDSTYRGYTVLELDMDKVEDGELKINVIPRTNIVPRRAVLRELLRRRCMHQVPRTA